jgi:two-component system, NarL family, response regulator NreC
MRVLIVDDEPIVRRDIADLIKRHDDLEICGEAANGEEAIEKALILKPHLVLIDITMPTMSGLDAAQRILWALPTTAVIFITNHDDPQILAEAKRLGARGYVSKTALLGGLAKAIDAVRRNQTYFEGGASNSKV